MVVVCCSVLHFGFKFFRQCSVFLHGHGLSCTIFGWVGLLWVVFRLFLMCQVVLV